MARRKMAEKAETVASQRRRFLLMSKKEYDSLGSAKRKKVIEVLTTSAAKTYSVKNQLAIKNQIAKLGDK